MPPLEGGYPRAGSWPIALGVGLVAFVLFAPAWFNGVKSEIALVGAERVLAGDIPYRDFWTMYAPGSSYLLAGLFGLFGTHVLVSAIAGTLFSAAAIGLAYQLILRITGRQALALATATVFTAAFFFSGYGQALSGYPPVIFCIVLALNFFVLYLDRGRRGYLLGAGLAIGVGAIFKHDVGAYSAVVIAAGLLVTLWARGGPGRPGAMARDLLSFGLAAALPVLPVVLALALVAGREAFQDAIVFPATDFSIVRGESNFPSLLPLGLYDPWKVKLVLNWARYLAFALPLLVCLASLPVIALAAWRHQDRVAGLGVVFALGFLFHYFAARVQINTHIISLTFYAACLGALVLYWAQTRRRSGRASWLRGLALLVLLGWLGALSASPVYALLDRQRLDSVSMTLPKISSLRLSRRESDKLMGLTAFVQGCVPPGQPIYVGLLRHDSIVISRPKLYFILDRPSATAYQELHPGIADTAPVQAEIIEELTSKDVQTVVLASIFDDEELDRRKAVQQAKLPYVGATDLDRFIRETYEQAAEFGNYSVWLKRRPGDAAARC